MQQTSGNLIQLNAPAKSSSVENTAARGSERTAEDHQRFRRTLNEAQSKPDNGADADVAGREGGRLLPPEGKSLPANDSGVRPPAAP